MSKKTSLKDIADKMGVSKALVSYVLNGKAEQARVSPVTAKKIKETAKKMNYRPSQLAKSLKSGKTLAIGLIVADISNPFFSQLARTIENESAENGYTVIFGSSDENAQLSKKLIQVFVDRNVDGLIIAPAKGTEKQLKYLKGLDIPFVLIDRHFEAVETSYVGTDNFKATYKATQELIACGHKDIAFICSQIKLQHISDRYKGYLQAMNDHFGPNNFKNLFCEVEFNSRPSFDKELQKLLKQDIDAVLFSNNDLSLMGLKAFVDMNIKIPDDLGVFCFDESNYYDLFYCPMSYVKQPLEEMAREAVQLLMKKFSTGEIGTSKVILDSELVIKESCGSASQS